MSSTKNHYLLFFSSNKNKLFTFINSLIISYILNIFYYKEISFNYLIPNYIVNLPVNFNFLFGYPFLIFKIYFFTVIFFFIFLYFEKIIDIKLSNKNVEFKKYANYLFFFSNISYLINLSYPNLFYSGSIDKITNFSYFHAILIIVISFYHKIFNPFDFNLKKNGIYIKIILSIACLLIFQYLLAIFFQSFFIWEPKGLVASNKYLRFFLKHTDLFFIVGVYFFLLLINKYKSLSNYFFFILSMPLIIKLSFVFSYYFIFFFLFFFWVNNKFNDNKKIFYLGLFFFLVNLFLPLQIILGHSSGFNYLHQGLASVFVLLSNQFATNYGISFGFFSDYLQSLIPFKLFGISIEILSYSVIFCRVFEIILCSIIIFELFRLKIFILFIILTISNILNFFPTDFTTPWTHEYRLLPYYIFIFNFFNFIKYRNHYSFLYLGISVGYFLLAATIDFIFPIIILLFLFLLLYLFQKSIFDFKLKKQNKYFYFIFNFINIFILFFVLNTLNFLYFVKLFNSQNLFYSFIASAIILYIFYNFNNYIKNKFFSFWLGFLFITLYWFFFIYSDYSLDLISLKNQFQFQKLISGYQEIARNYKPSAILVYDYFNSGIMSNELMSTIKSMTFVLDKFNFLNFMYYHSYILFFVIIFLVYSLFLFKYNDLSIFKNNDEIITIFIIFITSVFSFLLFIKYHLLPDEQRFLLGVQFYHLSLFFCFALFLKVFFFKNIEKIILLIFFYSLIPNLIMFKNEDFYKSNQYSGVKNFVYATTSLGELSNHYKTIIIKNYDTAPHSIKKGTSSMIDLVEHTYGPSVYKEMKEEMDIYYKFNFEPLKLNNIEIPFWTRDKIVNKFYLK